VQNKNDGGPAFPRTAYPEEGVGGMSLRDHFAAQALAGWYGIMWPKGDHDERDEVATICYAQADAMLEARNA
jgi:hypothetical protein